MPEPDTYSYPRYLQSKATVDERSLNRRVWTEFLRALEQKGPRVRIVEVGGGIGATLQRVVEALEKRTIDHLQYTFVDVTPENVETAVASTRRWAGDRGYDVSGEDEQIWNGESLDVSVQFMTADLLELSTALKARDAYDAVVGQAVFDLVPLNEAVASVRPMLQDDALWYLPIHFDGVTAFEPEITPSLDAKIERLYHASMRRGDEEGGDRGDRRGRTLLTELPQFGVSLLAAGGSDWVVLPNQNGYPDDEAYFLHHILHFIEMELSEDHPDLDENAFSNWIETRRTQIEDGKLIYIAHQLDVLGQC